MNIPRIALLPCALAVLATVLLPSDASAGIKCWTNSDGVRECGHAVPPEYAQKEYREMSETGVTVGTTARAKSGEELRTQREEEARLAAIEAEKARRIRERQAKDRVLLSTFTTEKDLTLAHEGQVAAIDIRIDHTERILDQLGKSLEQLHAQAANLERSGKTITPELKNKIAKVERQLQDSHSFIEKRRLQKAELASQFADDLDRYRELKGLTKKSN
jgi:hypothetical protein